MDGWASLKVGGGAAWALVAVGGALLVFQGIGGSPLLDPNEAKHALIAKHTLEAGRWLEPVLNGRPYHDKPSLFYILVGVCYRIFGVSEFSARLVPAISIWATLLATYALASRRSVQAGLLAVYLLASSLFFIHLGRFTDLDGIFTLALTAALFSALMSLPRVGPWRIPYVSFVFAGLATLIKGPVAIVMLAVPTGVAAFRPGLDWKRMIVGAGVTVAIVACWAVPVALRYPGYLVDFVWLHNLQRYFAEVQIFHPEPLLFFLPIVFGALLPWSGLLPLAIERALRSFNREFFLAVYALTVVAFFSLSSGKLATYVVPAFPALAVIVAWWSWDRLSEPGSKGRTAALVGVVAVMLLAPIGLAAAALAAPALLAAAACLIPASVAASGLWFGRRRFDNGTDIVALCCAGCLASSLLVGALAGPSVGRFTSDRDLATAALGSGRPDRMVVYRVRPFSFLFYTGWEGVYKVSDSQYRAAIAGPGRVLVLTKESRLAPLAGIVPGVQFETVARNARHLLLKPVSAQLH